MPATNAELMGQTLNDIANAIREKRDIYYNIPMLDMAEEIRKIVSENETIIVYSPNITTLSPDITPTVSIVQIPEISAQSLIDTNEPSLSVSVSVDTITI